MLANLKKELVAGVGAILAVATALGSFDSFLPAQWQGLVASAIAVLTPVSVFLAKV